MIRFSPEALLRVLPRLLRPLIRLLVQRGVTFPVFADLTRALFVDVAATDLAPEGRPATDSRVSLMTGVHRKEVRRVRQSGSADFVVPALVTLNTAIIARWLGAPGYQDARGDPAPLPRTAAPGQASFEQLVSAVTTDLRPRTVLDRWLDQGLVRLDPAGHVVTLRADAYVPAADEDAMLFFFARNLHDHLAASCANIGSGQAVFPDASVHYDGLSRAAARTLEDTARAAASRVLRDINRQALDRAASATDPAASEASPGDRHRVNFGIYLFTEVQAEPPPGPDAA